MTDHPAWWDPYSDQPYKLPADRKPRLSPSNLLEYGKIALTVAGIAPLAALRYAFQGKPRGTLPDMADLAGLSVSPQHRWRHEIDDMIDDLGVRNLLLRAPVWQLSRLDEIARFIDDHPQHQFVVNILQDAASVADPDRWRAGVERVFTTLSPICGTYQVGNAVNRSKWGCSHSGDALTLFRIADEVRTGFPGLRLLGSSVIDFEPMVQLRTLFNFHGYHMEGCAAQLYVNRRGSAYGKQYGYFNLERKIRLNHVLLSLSNNSDCRLWITETNWPLLDTKPWTPNSGHPRSTVDEDTQAIYLQQYFNIARETGLVEKVFWWQLVNPGYGLVDHRAGPLRKMPSYYAFRNLLGR